MMAPAILRRAIHRSDCPGVPIGAIILAPRVSPNDNFEVRSAAAIDPYTATILAPSATFNAFRFTVAFGEANRAVRARVAEAAMHVVGRAVDADVVRLIRVIGVGIATGFKVRSAAAIDPDTAVIVTPSRTVHTVCFTALAQETNAAGSVSLAGVPAHIVGRTRDCLRLRRAIVVGAAEIEISAASLVHPDSSARVTPSSAEDAFGPASLTS